MSKVYQVEVLGDDLKYSLEDIASRLQADERFIIECVEHGVVEVHDEGSKQWQFPAASLDRLRRARRLQRDLEINFTGLALVLDLLEDMEDMRRQMQMLEKRLGHWEK